MGRKKNGIDIQCPICSNPMHITACKVGLVNTCSMECRMELAKRKRAAAGKPDYYRPPKERWPIQECRHCQKEFKAHPYGKPVFCSIRCVRLHKKASMSGVVKKPKEPAPEPKPSKPRKTPARVYAKNQADFTCPICSKAITMQASRTKIRITCSNECSRIKRSQDVKAKKTQTEKPTKPPRIFRVSKVCQNPSCGKEYQIVPYRAETQKFCSVKCGALARAQNGTKEKKLLSHQSSRGQKSRTGDDARLKKREPDKLPTKPVDTVTPWYRDPSAPGNKLVQTQNPKPGYIPLNRNNHADN